MIPKLNIPTQPGPRPAPITPMVYVKDKTVWQYKVLTRNVANENVLSEEELSTLGKEGWELAAVLMHGGSAYFYFKRLKD